MTPYVLDPHESTTLFVVHALGSSLSFLSVAALSFAARTFVVLYSASLRIDSSAALVHVLGSSLSFLSFAALSLAARAFVVLATCEGGIARVSIRRLSNRDTRLEQPRGPAACALKKNRC